MHGRGQDEAPRLVTDLTPLSDAPRIDRRIRLAVGQVPPGVGATAVDVREAVVAGQRLRRHPTYMPLIPMWHAIRAEATARLVGRGHARRIGRWAAPTCERFFVDQTKNASRRFCSLACQNRAKAAALRERRSRPPRR